MTVGTDSPNKQRTNPRVDSRDQRIAELEAVVETLMEGGAKMSVAYLAIRLRETERNYESRISALEKRLDKASEAYREIKGLIKETNDG